MTDPQTAADAAERVQAFLDAWDTTEYLAEMTEVAGPFDGVPALTTYDLRALLADRARMAAELEQVRGERAADDKRTERTMGLLAERVGMLLIEVEQVRGDLARARDDSSEVWLAERGKEMRDALTAAAELIDRLAFDDECDLDHHGYCQAHNLHSMPCPHPLGRRFVEAWRTVQAADAERSDTEAATAASARPADGLDGTGESQRTGVPVREAQRGSQGRAEFESFLTDASRRAVAEFFAEAAQESDDFDIDAVIAQNHADAARDWGLDDGPTP